MLQPVRWIGFAVIAFVLNSPASPQSSTDRGDTDTAAIAVPASGTPRDLSSPPNSFSTVYQGNVLMAEHRYQAALAIYASIPDRTADLWYRMGVAYQMLSSPKEAVRCYKESLKLDPDNPSAMNNLATVYDLLQDYSQAEKLYRRALSFNPRSVVYLKNLGTDLMAQNKVEAGNEVYQQALTIDPHALDKRNGEVLPLPHAVNAEANYVKARSCAQAGLVDCTVDYLRRALNEGSATPGRIAADPFFQPVRDTPAVQQLLAER